MIKKVSIIGLGLIGGSLAKAIKEYTNIKIIGVDIDENYIHEAIREGIIDKGIKNIQSTLDADVVFICSPVGEIINCIKNVIPYLKDGCIITDVGSTKKSIMDMIDKVLTQNTYFIGGHPMTGSEKSGFYASDVNLFKDNSYFIVPHKNTPTEIVNMFIDDIIKKIGAKPVIIDDVLHDKITGIISHVPHILSATLTNFAYKEDLHAIKFAAGGFKDTTRISMSQTEMWKDIVISNKDIIRELLVNYEKMLNEFISFIDSNDIQSICRFFDTAREIRKSISL
ncbi:prephenate dehydrogenase [Thermoanaerobacterium sp. RBIITD]|uniref:prephenate dehydrogenase n=1 Tax=Thermoanaerobacterium sp. RBIITD TaxID=1550240 RepID=UPI000BB8572C|nr:prephenate dehydrogenase [Thermoanaerobacterium sp. RBIITD]SNX52692.1 prephenate dehydrogenase [Thermoanaerobacterium sp. RBIITD]